MAWSGSEVFTAFIKDALDNTTAFDLGADSIKEALFNNSITPDQDATSANTAYDVDEWASANEASDAGQWAAGGIVLGSRTFGSGTATVTLDAADTASGSSATLTAYGVLDYDDTLSTPVADQGICYRYFGGQQTITDGTFTIVHHANGIMQVTG